jgi:hypothetical protein
MLRRPIESTLIMSADTQRSQIRWGVGARIEALRRSRAPKLTINVADGPHSWDEIQSSSKVQYEVSRE